MYFFFLPYLVTLVFVVGAGCCVIAAGLLWEFLGFFNAHQCLVIAHTDTRLRSQRVVILSYKAKASTWHPVPSPSSRSFAAQLVIVVIRAFCSHYKTLLVLQRNAAFFTAKSFGVSFINQAFSIPNVGIVLQSLKIIGINWKPQLNSEINLSLYALSNQYLLYSFITGERCVHLAAEAGHIDILRILVSHGADINARVSLRNA